MLFCAVKRQERRYFAVALEQYSNLRVTALFICFEGFVLGTGFLVQDFWYKIFKV